MADDNGVFDNLGASLLSLGGRFLEGTIDTLPKIHPVGGIVQALANTDEYKNQQLEKQVRKEELLQKQYELAQKKLNRPLQEEINKNIAVGYELPETNMTDFIDTYNTEERIEKYAEERTIEKVRMEIKEGTLTNAGATVVIYDDNEYHFAYHEQFSIERKENNQRKEVPYFIPEDNESGVLPLFDMIGVKPKEENPIEMEQNWTRIYGELPQGEYRLIKSVSTYNGDQQPFYVEFTIE